LNIPKKYKNQLAVLKNVLRNPKNKSFFVAGHHKPDGDTVGGSLAVYSLLRRLKKDVFLCNYDSIPEFLKFLPFSEKIKSVRKTDKKFDAAIILECSELSRFGNIINPQTQSKITINIDHHVFQRDWADINWADPSSSSVSEMIYYLFKFLKLPLTKREAISLYTGIVTDTHNFTNANTNFQSHAIAAELIDMGVEPSFVEKEVYKTKSLNALRLLSLALKNIKPDRTGKIAYTNITNSVLRETKATPEDTEEIVNYPGMLPGVLVWMLFKETNLRNSVKVSFRSVKNVDVNKVARIFSGGGHKNASGCTVEGTMKNVIAKVVKTVQKELKK